MKRLIALILCLLLCCPLVRAERLADERLLSYYDDCLFIGDSIMQGFVRYRSAMRESDPSFLENLTVVCTSSISLYTASRHVMDKDSHFLYRGMKCTMYDIVKLLKPRCVFILLGLNDPVGIKIAKAMQWVEYIIVSMPDYSRNTDVCFFSHTPVTETYCLTKKREGYQDRINEYNSQLREICSRLGAAYVEIAEPFKDENGYLSAAYTSDNICHLNDDGIALWIQTLMNYAQSQYDAGFWTPGTAEAPEAEAGEHAEKKPTEDAAGKPATKAEPLRNRVWALLADRDELLRKNPDDLSVLSGIDQDYYTDYAFFVSRDALSGREVIVLSARDEEAADRIETLLRRYLNRRLAETRDDLPEAHALLSRAEIVRDQLLVMLVSGENADAEVQMLTADE